MMRPAVLLQECNTHGSGFHVLLSCKKHNSDLVTGTLHTDNISMSDDIITEAFKLVTKASSPLLLLLPLLLLQLNNSSSCCCYLYYYEYCISVSWKEWGS
jgi:hypothetical protein